MKFVYDGENNLNEINIKSMEEQLKIIRLSQSNLVYKPSEYNFNILVEEEILYEEVGFDIGDIMNLHHINGIPQLDRQFENDGGFNAKFYPIKPKHDSLYHQAWFGSGENLKDIINEVLENKVLGYPNIRHPTEINSPEVPGGYQDMTSDYGIVFSPDYKIVFTSRILFEIDIKRLTKDRSIFYNPEYIGNETEIEFQNKFIIFGGIPCQAIKNIRVDLIEPEDIDDPDTYIIQPSGIPLTDYINNRNK